VNDPSVAHVGTDVAAPVKVSDVNFEAPITFKADPAVKETTVVGNLIDSVSSV
jgi:hypothetical protein